LLNRLKPVLQILAGSFSQHVQEGRDQQVEPAPRAGWLLGSSAVAPAPSHPGR
jgi:hypothetical protein